MSIAGAYLSAREIILFYRCESLYCDSSHISAMNNMNLIKKIPEGVSKTVYLSERLRQIHRISQGHDFALTQELYFFIKMESTEFKQFVSQVGALLFHNALRTILKREQVDSLRQKIGKKNIEIAIRQGAILVPSKLKGSMKNIRLLEEAIVAAGLQCLFASLTSNSEINSRLALKMNKNDTDAWHNYKENFIFDKKLSLRLVSRVLEF